MTDNEIIKALEWHSNDEVHCSACPYEEHSVTHYCVDMVIKDALDLINRQKAEIEMWKSSAELWEGDAKDLFISREQIKAEAIKEFAERLKEYINGIIERHEMPMFPFSVAFVSGMKTKIDNLVKEKVGDAE